MNEDIKFLVQCVSSITIYTIAYRLIVKIWEF